MTPEEVKIPQWKKVMVWAVISLVALFTICFFFIR